MIDAYHGYIHDINLANYGMEAIKNISVQLSSSQLELDPYWTLSGNSSLEAMNDMIDYNYTDYNSDVRKSGESLQPQARIRLLPKNNIEEGSRVSGTLTIKSGSTTLMVLKLTGIVGDPVITTKKVPKSVKYVPYGSVVQNSNKYSWNKVTYKLKKGKLPKGMKIKPNGEIYGVPKKAGKYKFTILLDNSYSKFKDSMKEYTFTVLKNTDKNVDKATDKGYTISTKIKNIREEDTEDTYLMVSEGVFENFVDIYLDGEKLAKGTDYDAESGSTRITIASQTLKKHKKGKHTLGLEFREKDTDELKKSAQNYELTSDGRNNSGKKNNKPVKPVTPIKPIDKQTNPVKPIEPVTPEITKDMKEYVIKAGDTLWDIAVAKYGKGSDWIKIFEANEGIVPERLRIGQKIVLP